jgi:predicted Fe-Mo cluster-binding NifX family protein
MRICFVSEGPDPSAEVDCRFGRARYFVIFDTHTRKHDSIDNRENVSAGENVGVNAAREIVNRGCDWVVCGHIGQNAMEVLKENDVRVAVGACGVVWDAIEAFENDELHEITTADMTPEPESSDN